MQYFIVIKRSSIEVKHNGKSLIIELANGGQEHGDILDEDIYKNLVKQGLTNEKLKPGSAAIILGNEITYFKFFPMVKGKINPAEVEKFKDGLPIEPDNIVAKILIGKDKYGVVAVNKALFEILANILTEDKWKIESIKPEIFKNKNGKDWDLRE